MSHPVPAPSVLALFGPTASGKSAVAHGVARRLDGEIVVADPFQRYRGLEIAADSPRPAERAEVPYHLVADLDVTEGSSAGQYAAAAHRVIDDILARGRVPIVTGGTGLYLRAATCELGFPEAPDPKTRAWAEALVADDPEAARTELMRRDPETFAAVDTANPRRLARALERSVTSQPTGAALFTAEPRHPTLTVSLSRPREVIDALILTRVHRELDEGLVAELEAVIDTPGVAREPLQIIGAAEVMAIRQGELSRDELPERLAVRTRRLARRQLQWRRRMTDTLDIEMGEEPAAHGIELVCQAWQSAQHASAGRREP